MKLAFYGSQGCTRIMRILDRIGRTDPELLGAVSFVLVDHRENAELRALCSHLRVTLHEHAPEGETAAERSRRISGFFLDKLEGHGVDHAFIFCDKLLRGPLLERYRNRIINFHPSLLPAFPGLKSIDRALAAGAFLLGNTAHFIDEGMDTGPVIMQSIVPRSRYRDYESVLEQQIPMALQIIRWLQQGRLRVENGRVEIVGADYGVDEFIPALET